MKLRKKRRATLIVEHLEDRCVPAYLVPDPGAFTVRGANDQHAINSFQLQAIIQPRSDPFDVTVPGGANQRWMVNSTPSFFQEISIPTQREWNLLCNSFPTMAFGLSQQRTLADRSLVIKDAEALGPNNQLAQNMRDNPAYGQSLFLQYNPNPGDVADPGNPTQASLHWIQFVTAMNWRNQAGETFKIDNENGPTPFYDDGGIADGTGFMDMPANLVRPALLPVTFSADLFLVQDVPNGRGGRTEVVWQGVRWGWETGPVRLRPRALAPDAGPIGGGYAVNIAGNGFSDATNVYFGGVPASSFTINSDTSITAIVPAQDAGPVDVTVVTPYGTSSTSPDDLFTYGKSMPTITWNAPSDIPFGTPLDNMQLNASADVAGAFTYSQVVGTVLSAGASNAVYDVYSD